MIKVKFIPAPSISGEWWATKTRYPPYKKDKVKECLRAVDFLDKGFELIFSFLLSVFLA